MHVMQVVPSLVFGGAEVMAVNLARGLRAQGITVDFVSLYDREDTSDSGRREFPLNDIHVETLGKRHGADPRAVVRLRRAIGQRRPDIVHVHQHAVRYVLAATMGRTRTHVVHTLHTIESAQRSWVNNVLHLAARVAAVETVAVAPAVASSYTATGRYRELRVVPNGIDIRRFHADSAAGSSWRRRVGIDPAAVVFVCVARFHPLKDHELLVRAFADLAAECRDAVLVLAGDGPTRQTIESEVGRLGIASQVRFLGATGDVVSVLQGSDVFVLASRWEGHPLSILEAMAVGLPIIAPCVGGIGEIVSSGVNGTLVAAGDETMLAAAIRRLYESTTERHELGRRAREIAVESFSLEVMTDAYLAIYQHLVASGPHRRRDGADGGRGVLR